jgi:hypothetical protein
VSEIQFGKRYFLKAGSRSECPTMAFPIKYLDKGKAAIVVSTDRGERDSSVDAFLDHYELDDQPAPDPVNNPSHYKAGDIECVDLLRALHGEEAFKIHCHLTMVSYLFRLGKKGDPAEDMRKAMRYGQYYLGEDKSNVDN